MRNPPYYTDDAVTIWNANALALPVQDQSVDLVVTSPPYFGLRSYQDGGEHYAGQIGDEASPHEFVDALVAATAEMVRALKPSGSLWINLGDKYCSPGGHTDNCASTRLEGRPNLRKQGRPDRSTTGHGVRAKSLFGIPWRYALRCVDDLGLILRAEVIWSKPNGLPESVTDRVRRSHETWFHFTVRPQYYSAVDEIREAHEMRPQRRLSAWVDDVARPDGTRAMSGVKTMREAPGVDGHPLGKLPGSVWEIPTQPLRVPEHLGIDHFACVDTETEILTRAGWKRHDAVTQDDEVAGLDLDTGLTRWTGVHGVHRYLYDGDMVTADARGLSMRLTPNHRTLVHRFAGRHRTRQPLEVIRADEVTGRHAIPRSVQWAEDGREKAIGADLAALLGWVAAEGWYSPNRAVYLSQSITRNSAKVDRIDALIGRLGGAYRKDRDRVWRGEAWVDAAWRLNPELAADVRRIMPDKLLPSWLADLPLTEARALLDAFIDGDGHRRVDGRIGVFQKFRHNLDVLQCVAVRLGYNTTLAESGGRWVLYLNPSRPARLRRSDGTSLVGREHYKGVVWCVTTGTGTFVARRRGTVFVTGNSFPMEWPRRIIRGWSPSGICVECGEGRAPVSTAQRTVDGVPVDGLGGRKIGGYQSEASGVGNWRYGTDRRIVGEKCACPEPTATTRPAVILDPFGGTGTTALVARALGRKAVHVDLSADYCRLAQWRVTDPGELARAMQVEKPPPAPEGVDSLLDLIAD